MKVAIGTPDGGRLEDVSPEEEASILAERAEHIKIKEATQYIRDRTTGISAYPPVGEQLDLLWHAIDGGALNKTSGFYTELKKVKDDNPKP